MDVGFVNFGTFKILVNNHSTCRKHAFQQYLTRRVFSQFLQLSFGVNLYCQNYKFLCILLCFTYHFLVPQKLSYEPSFIPVACDSWSWSHLWSHPVDDSDYNWVIIKLLLQSRTKKRKTYSNNKIVFVIQILISYITNVKSPRITYNFSLVYSALS